MIGPKFPINKAQAQARAIQTLVESSSKEALNWFKQLQKEVEKEITDLAMAGNFGLKFDLGQINDEELIKMADLLIVVFRAQGFHIEPMTTQNDETQTESFQLQISWG